MEHRYSLIQSPLHYACSICSPTEEVCFLRKLCSCTPCSAVSCFWETLNATSGWITSLSSKNQKHALHFFLLRNTTSVLMASPLGWAVELPHVKQQVGSGNSTFPIFPVSSLPLPGPSFTTQWVQETLEKYICVLHQLHISSFSWQGQCSRHLAQCLPHLIPQPHLLCTLNHISALQPFELEVPKWVLPLTYLLHQMENAYPPPRCKWPSLEAIGLFPRALSSHNSLWVPQHGTWVCVYYQTMTHTSIMTYVPSPKTFNWGQEFSLEWRQDKGQNPAPSTASWDHLGTNRLQPLPLSVWNVVIMRPALHSYGED